MLKLCKEKHVSICQVSGLLKHWTGNTIILGSTSNAGSIELLVF